MKRKTHLFKTKSIQTKKPPPELTNGGFKKLVELHQVKRASKPFNPNFNRRSV